jgi:hypothetical protein
LMGDFHRSTCVLNRLVSCPTTQDGTEPGVWVGLVKRRAPALVVGGVGNVDDSG